MTKQDYINQIGVMGEGYGAALRAGVPTEHARTVVLAVAQAFIDLARFNNSRFNDETFKDALGERLDREDEK